MHYKDNKLQLDRISYNEEISGRYDSIYSYQHIGHIYDVEMPGTYGNVYSRVISRRFYHNGDRCGLKITYVVSVWVNFT